MLALRKHPLDRIRLMKALFLIWHRSGRNIPNYFQFQPYYYGPCSFDIYRKLDTLLEAHFIIQPPTQIQKKWSDYYLTQKGKIAVQKIARKTPSHVLKILDPIVEEVSKMSFRELLLKVYKEAPDFATNSVIQA